MTARRLLVVSYYHPPAPNVGGYRWQAIGKYLRRLGHDVTFLTTNAWGSLADDAEQAVVRAPDLVASGALRALLRRPPLAAAGAEVPLDKPPPALLSRVAVPDPYLVSWVPAATGSARRLAGKRAIDAVITTSTPDSAHFVGMALRSRAAWLADFRDGWAFDAPRDPFPTRVQRRLDVSLERLVVHRADAVVGLSRPVVDDLRARLGVDARYVPSAWDPDLDADVERAPAPPLEPDTVTLVYTGKLSGVWGRDPAALFEAIKRLRRDEPRLGGRLRLLVAGRLDAGERRLIDDPELGGAARHLGYLPRAAAARLQRSADALVLITSPTLVWELPGKVLEYLAAGRPILALAKGTEAGRVVEETGTGLVVSQSDPDEIAAALRRVATGELSRTYSPRQLEQFLQPAPARAIADLVERALERRGAGRPRAVAT